MPKFAAGIEYLGTNFHGFQTQKNLPTIQERLEQALSDVADENIKVVCSGRTDAGVHAKEQLIHFHTNANRSSRAWLLGTNHFLPKDISMLWIKEVSNNFHARFDSYAREYHYLIYNSAVRSPLKHKTHCWEPRNLNIDNMQKACRFLLGTHDFTSFQDSQCQAKSTIKNIEYLTIGKYDDSEIIIKIKANAFLHHMVRNIVGTLLVIGFGNKPYYWIKKVLDAKDRKIAGMTAPAHGLYFIKAYHNCI